MKRLSRSIRILGLFYLTLIANPLLGMTSESLSCSICGMDINEHSKIGFEASFEGKTIHFCSLSCAMRFHEKHKEVSILGYDFEDSKKVDTKDAFFLVKSTKALKELEFGMPPSVVIFASNEKATKTQTRLGDGQIVKGFEEAVRSFR